MEYRLNKYISASGFCSRREADKHIEEGRVTVNGKKAYVGMRVLPGQQVKVSGLIIENDIQPVYIAFNKPVGVVSTTDNSEKDNIVDFISHEQRIFPVGRLDKDSQGLIILTNDGDIVNKMLRAGNNHKKEYIVTVNKLITEDFLKGMAGGVPILDRVTRRCHIEEVSPYVFKITLIQGLNRQIRRMCEYFGYEVTKLERIQIMNIKLGSLGQGNWRNLTERELEGLFDMIEESENEDKPKAQKASGKKPAAKSASKPTEKREGRLDSGKHGSDNGRRKDASGGRSGSGGRSSNSGGRQGSKSGGRSGSNSGGRSGSNSGGRSGGSSRGTRGSQKSGGGRSGRR